MDPALTNEGQVLPQDVGLAYPTLLLAERLLMCRGTEIGKHILNPITINEFDSQRLGCSRN
jgi:hypothetical protein